MATNVTNAAETNLITVNQMKKVREVDFVEQFSGNILPKLQEALGVTRQIPMIEGTTMYVYKTAGALVNDGNVPEGEIIPLSQYERTKEAVGEITLKKWRKAASAESIKKSGYEEAVTRTDAKLLNDVQKGIRTDFFEFLTGLDGQVVAGDTLQKVLAGTWGQLQVLFEDDAVETVHFINPLTISEYLGTAQITMQTAFGMQYIEDFLGLGTVIMNSNIAQGTVISTAKENIIMYYLAMSGDIARAFELTADATGYIGIKSGYQNEERAQIESLIMSGIQFLVEYVDGVVVGQIDSTPTLGSVTVTSTVGTAIGDSNIAMSGYTLGTGEKYVYKTGVSTAPSVAYGQKLGSTWTEIDSGDDITPAENHTKITVAAIDANGRAQAAGNTTITVKTA